MSLIIPLNDIVTYNSQRVLLIRRETWSSWKDRGLVGTKVLQTYQTPNGTEKQYIRAYIFPTDNKTRIFMDSGAGEIEDHVITMWVSNRWLTQKSITIALQDMVLYKDKYYEIISQIQLDSQTKMSAYRLKKWIGYTDYDPLPSSHSPPTETVFTVGDT